MLLGILVLVNILAQVCFFRLDLTDDKRYSLSAPTKKMMKELPNDVHITLYLSGELNAGFLRLQTATEELLDELGQYGKLSWHTLSPNDLPEKEQQALQQALAKQGLNPTAIYEQSKQGSQKQTIVYPFALVQLNGKQTFVPLLQNNRGLSGAENLNHSMEGLEYTFAETIHTLSADEMPRVAFIEGHGELPEQQTADIQMAFSRYADVYRGAITDDVTCLDGFQAIVIADPQMPFSDKDKYILDQYIMHGGRVLWVVSGVRFSETVLEDAGYTPAIPLDLNLTDMFFRYGVRVNAHLVQDLQCLPIPVDVSQNPQQPQYQAMPWTFAPLLLTSGASPITRNVMQVSATFASDISLVGDGENQQRDILLATGSASKLTPTPGEVNLMDLHINEQAFTHQLVPVAASIEGVFPSLFAHRMLPEGVQESREKLALSVPTKQVWVSCGSVIRNDWQNGQPLPVGYDRYSKVQFGNRDFLVNALLYLTDDTGFINLRQKTIPLRMLNEQRNTVNLLWNQIMGILLPLLLLAIVGVVTIYTRKKRYAIP